MTHVWVTKRDGKISATSLEYQQRGGKKMRITFSLMPGIHALLVKFPLSRPLRPAGLAHYLARHFQAALLGKMKPFQILHWNTTLQNFVWEEASVLITRVIPWPVFSPLPLCYTLINIHLVPVRPTRRACSQEKHWSGGGKVLPVFPLMLLPPHRGSEMQTDHRFTCKTLDYHQLQQHEHMDASVVIIIQ